jgi:Cof subfamily protein (haloacid dehalogenase superfamily)
MKNKAIIIDLDGTAIDSPDQKLASQRLKEAIRNLEDRYFICAATGRSWTFAKDLLQDLELEDPCVISGGTRICLPKTGEIIWQHNIEKAAAKQILQIMSEYSKYKILCNDYSEDDYFNGGLSADTFVLPEEVYFLEQVFVPEKIAFIIQEKISQIPNVICTMVFDKIKGCRDLHITNAQATKEHAIAILLEKTAVSKNNSIGVGDGNNDFHLFAGVGLKIAMGNAVPDLKELADQIIGDVKNDGLAEYFESLS